VQSVAENSVKTGCLNPECAREKCELQHRLDVTSLEYNNYKVAMDRENEHKEIERKLTSEREAENKRHRDTERDLVQARAELRSKDELSRKNVEIARMDVELRNARAMTKSLKEENTCLLAEADNKMSFLKKENDDLRRNRELSDGTNTCDKCKTRPLGNHMNIVLSILLTFCW